MLKAPRFWYRRSPPVWSYALWPVSFVYRFLVCLRAMIRRPQRAPFPVISVGNLVMGGAGKTPVVIALAHMLKNKGWRPVIISKGYGGRLLGPIWVDPLQHIYRDVGDEALLLARAAPTLVSRRRARALDHIPAQDNLVLLLDDGHQQRDLVVDLAFLVENKDQGLGNGCVFPQGPLRESKARGLKRCHGLFTLGGPLSYQTTLPIFETAIVPKTDLAPGAHVWGVAGIGYPDKFRKTLETLKLTIEGFTAFADHYPYDWRDMEKVAAQAFEKDAVLVTTEKDWMRWPEGAVVPHVVTLSVCWRSPDKLLALIQDRLGNVKRDH